jgi:hypothetical protein
MTIKTKLGNSATLNKLLNHNHESAIASVKHDTNAQIQVTALKHYDSEAQNIKTIHTVCLDDAKEIFNTESNACKSTYAAANNNDTTIIVNNTEGLVNCINLAVSTYNTSNATCYSNLEANVNTLGDTVDGILSNLFSL